MTGYEQRFYEMFPSLVRATEDNAKTSEAILKELMALNQHIATLTQIIKNERR